MKKVRLVLSADDEAKSSDRISTTASRTLLIAVAVGVLLAGCASSEQAALDPCKSPWAYVGNNSGKTDRPAVARIMAAAHCE